MSSEKVDQLMQAMTTAEKIGQLIQTTADVFPNGDAVVTGPMKSANMSAESVYTIGTVLGISGAKKVEQIQYDYLQHNRLKIPLIFMADVIHGYQTIFPIPLALGASFNPETMKIASQVAAQESAAGGIHVTFAPMVDLVRDPRWGRVMESTGEDPYLNSVMATASVQGFQGDSLDDHHVAACVKHFAAYGAAEAGREYNTVDVSEWRFKEQYLPAYQAAVDAQAALVMTSFNTLFGVPASANQHLMRDILRQEMAFNGVLISDWGAVAELINHGVAGDHQAAADLALKAGVDIDMMGYAYAKYLEKAADLDTTTAQLIDESARRVLELKDKLGLFTDPYRGLDDTREATEIKTTANLQAAQAAAEDSIVLLKNDRAVLPLVPETRAALIGPVTDSGDILGSWSWQGDPAATETIKTALSAAMPNLTFAAGSDYRTSSVRDLKEAVALARQQDVIIAALGLPADESGEATSLANIQLPAEQLVLLRELAKLNKPIISVIVAGRPLDLTEVADLSTAILFAWFPGSKGAAALSRILLGEVNPSGKLPMTFPRSVGQVPIYYNEYRTGRPSTNPFGRDDIKYQSKYMDEVNAPLYPFGFGLSYADISVKAIELAQTTVTPADTLAVTVHLENQSTISGKTVIECYTHQQVGETVRPVKSLVAFEKVEIAGESLADFTIEIPCEHLASVHQDLHQAVDSGEYQIMVGLDSDNLITVPFTIE